MKKEKALNLRLIHPMITTMIMKERTKGLKIKIGGFSRVIVVNIRESSMLWFQRYPKISENFIA